MKEGGRVIGISGVGATLAFAVAGCTDMGPNTVLIDAYEGMNSSGSEPIGKTDPQIRAQASEEPVYKSRPYRVVTGRVPGVNVFNVEGITCYAEMSPASDNQGETTIIKFPEESRPPGSAKYVSCENNLEGDDTLQDRDIVPGRDYVRLEWKTNLDFSISKSSD